VAGRTVHLVTLRPVDASAFTAPGQYVQVTTDANGYFVLAGEVGAPTWELLVRPNGGASDALVAAAVGTTFAVAGPFGSGFPVARAEGRRLVLAVVGSALGAARPLLKMRDPATTALYLGVRRPVDTPVADEVARFVRAGGHVVLCVSAEDDDPSFLPEARRAKGWVQQVLAAERPEAGAVVFAAGPETMLDAVRALPELEVHTNV